jgi:TRAP-type C4-dicarboxylate transport system permease small subunit
MIDRVALVLSRLGANVATCALFLIMTSATLDVASRNLGGRSLPGVVESAEITLVIGAFLGLAYAQRIKAHVATSIITDLFPRQLARLMRIIGLGIVSFYIGLATWVSTGRAFSSFQTGEVRFGLIEIPQWPARAAIALGFALLLLEMLRDLVRMVRGIPDNTDTAPGAL